MKIAYFVELTLFKRDYESATSPSLSSYVVINTQQLESKQESIGVGVTDPE